MAKSKARQRPDQPMGGSMNAKTPQAQIPNVVLEHERAIDLYMIAVGAMAIIALVAIVGAIVLAFVGKAIPGEVWTVVGIAVGALSVMIGGERK